MHLRVWVELAWDTPVAYLCPELARCRSSGFPLTYNVGQPSGELV